jgi:hypothetical protein
MVVEAVREHLKPSPPSDERSLVESHVRRIEVQDEHVVIELAHEPTSDRPEEGAGTVRIPWHKTLQTRRRELLLPASVSRQHARPIRSETRATLLAAIGRGRRWLGQMMASPTADAASIAQREGCSVRKVNMTISLAFLAPDLVKAAIDGQLPRGMGVARLADMPAEWSQQHQLLGLPMQS